MSIRPERGKLPATVDGQNAGGYAAADLGRFGSSCGAGGGNPVARAATLPFAEVRSRVVGVRGCRLILDGNPAELGEGLAGGLVREQVEASVAVTVSRLALGAARQLVRVGSPRTHQEVPRCVGVGGPGEADGDERVLLDVHSSYDVAEAVA